jgi:hypothetical protein
MIVNIVLFFLYEFSLQGFSYKVLMSQYQYKNIPHIT